MAAAVQGVESGTVMWSVLAATQDTNDADREPNFGSFRGTVMFTPSRNSIRRLLPTPITIFLDVVQGEVGDDGILRDLSGLPGVVLVSPWATGIEETGWTWEASFALNQREKVSFSFDFMPDEVVDLTKETPVFSSPGIVMTKGDKGDAATIAVGNVATGTPGSLATVANTGTSAAAVLDFTIPRGDVGATPKLAGTSTTSKIPSTSTGSQTFTCEAGIDAFVVGQYVRAVSRSTPTDYIAGQVTAYPGTTVTISVQETSGSTARSDWNLVIAGVKGTTGNTGAVPAISGTSTTSYVPSNGSKAFTTQAGIQGFTVGQYVRIASAATPGDYMAGNITAYSTTSLTVNVVEFAGAGVARTDWNISLAGTRGVTGTAATVAVGTVTTGAAGSSAAVANGGTSAAAVLNFTIPKGDKGDQGIQGLAGDLMPVLAATTWSGTIDLSPWTVPSTATRTLAGNTVISILPTDAGAARSGTITVIAKQAASGGPFTLTWPSSLEWAGDAPAPIMPTVANAELMVHLLWTGVAWRGFVGGVFYP